MQGLDFAKHRLSVDLLEVKNIFAEDFNGICRYLVKKRFEGIMRMDLEACLGADRYERRESRQGHPSVIAPCVFITKSLLALQSKLGIPRCPIYIVREGQTFPHLLVPGVPGLRPGYP